MSTYSAAAAGLKTVLEANITGLQAYDYPPDSINSFPAAAILPEPIDLLQAFGGNTFEAQFRVVILLSSSEDISGFRALYDYISPTEASKGIKQAVDADPTLNGSVDSSQVSRIENIGRRELWGGWFYGFDALVDFVKTIA